MRWGSTSLLPMDLRVSRRNMNFPDTTMGGADGAFPETTWGMLSQIRGPLTDKDRTGLELLCARYWKPIYRYIRIAWAKSNEDAKDLTQAFLLWLMEGDALSRYLPERGGLRRYLKVLLKRFVNHQEEAVHRLKRGGGAHILSLDLDQISQELDLETTSPEAAFDHAWLVEVAQRALERIRIRYESGDRALHFRLYDAYELTPNAKPTYAELAARFEITETDVKNYLFSVREAVRAQIRAELLETAASPDDLEQDWRELFSA